MSDVLTLSTRYNGVEYYLLVGVSELIDAVRYRVTVITEYAPKLYGTLEFLRIGENLEFVDDADFSDKQAIPTIEAALLSYLSTPS